ncbi:MAG: hypothetical protein ABIS74_07030 [Ferruginibacter sp.]
MNRKTMTTKEKPAYEQNYTEEERKIAEHIIGPEKSALGSRWGRAPAYVNPFHIISKPD